MTYLNRHPLKAKAMKPNAQLVKYHQDDLMQQISQLKDQIETNLSNRESIKHLKHLIQERELYLTEYLDAARPPSRSTAIKAALAKSAATTTYGPNWQRE